MPTAQTDPDLLPLTIRFLFDRRPHSFNRSIPFSTVTDTHTEGQYAAQLQFRSSEGT